MSRWSALWMSRMVGTLTIIGRVLACGVSLRGGVGACWLMFDGRAPVEVTTTFATTVDDVAAAWVLVMDRVDLVGGDPQVVVNPVRWFVDDGEEFVRRFEVSVSGMVEE